MYIAQLTYITHGVYVIYSGARVTDVPKYIYIYIIYRLRTFNLSMWGSLRLAPISPLISGAYPGFEKGGCLRTNVESIYCARIFFATSPTNCACASSTWLLLLVGVVDVGCPAQFNISANGMAGDGDHNHGDHGWRDSST